MIVLLGAWIFPSKLENSLASHIPFIGRFGIRHVLSFDGGTKTTLTLLLIALSIGLLSHHFGFHPAIGAYMAGLIIKEKYFHVPNSEHDHQTNYENTKKTIDDIAFNWLGPVFFVELGTNLIFDLSIITAVLPYIAILALCIFLAQVSSAAIAARFTGNFSWADSMMIGFGMLGRAELAFVVIDIAYVQYQIMPIEAFYTMMGVAFCLNIAVPVSIRLWKPYYNKAQSDQGK